MHMAEIAYDLKTCLPEEGIPEIHRKIYEKRGGAACYRGLFEKGCPRPVIGLFTVSKVDLPILKLQEKGPLQRLEMTRFIMIGGLRHGYLC